MTTEIPDDVVERAYAAYDAAGTEHRSVNAAIRAALRVAVEWEREQCARVAERPISTPLGVYAARPAVAAAIRSRKDRTT